MAPVVGGHFFRSTMFAIGFDILGFARPLAEKCWWPIPDPGSPTPILGRTCSQLRTGRIGRGRRSGHMTVRIRTCRRTRIASAG